VGEIVKLRDRDALFSVNLTFLDMVVGGAVYPEEEKMVEGRGSVVDISDVTESCSKESAFLLGRNGFVSVSKV